MGGDCFKMPRFFVRKSDIYGDSSIYPVRILTI